MSKKLVKILICLAGIVAVIAGVIYYFNNKKAKDDAYEEEEEDTVEEDHLDATDALDLSSLKFSRHYVDLR